MPGKMPSELNLMRRRLGLGETGETRKPGMLDKAYDFMGGRTGLGGMAGMGLGAALAPISGFSSFLIPALAGAAGAGAGALTEGKNPLKEGLTEGALDLAIPGGARLVKPAFRLGREAIVKTFAGRTGVSEAAESLLRKWLEPTVKASELYAQAEATRATIPYNETARAVNQAMKTESGRMPLGTQKEILGVLEPLEKFMTPATTQGGKAVKSAPVSDAMAEVRRLGLEVKRAFKAGNSDLGRTLNNVRAAMLDDLERAGAPEVKAASRAYRKEMAIDELSRNISRPQPGVKVRDLARKNPLFKGAFDPGEWSQINRIVEKLEHVAPSGGSGIIGRATTTLFGSEAAGIPGAVAGWLGPDAIRWLLSTPYGRGVTERVLASEIKPSGRTLGVLAKVAEALASGKLTGEPEQ